MRFLFVDRILELEEGKLIRGIKHITADDPFLSESPQVFPSAFIGEALGQLAAWNAMKTQKFQARPVAGTLSCAKIYRPVLAHETLLLESFIEQLDESIVAYESQARVGEELVFTLEGALGPMLPMEKFIDEAAVKCQFEQLYRPGDFNQLAQTLNRPPSSEKTSHFHITTPVHYPHLLFQFDHLLSFKPGVSVQAEKRINFAAPYFPDHFPRHPVLPLTVLLESQCLLTQKFLMASDIHAYRLLELRKIKMKDFVRPGDIIQTQLTLQTHEVDRLSVHASTSLEGKRICTVDMIFTKDLAPCKQDV